MQSLAANENKQFLLNGVNKNDLTLSRTFYLYHYISNNFKDKWKVFQVPQAAILDMPYVPCNKVQFPFLFFFLFILLLVELPRFAWGKYQL